MGKGGGGGGGGQPQQVTQTTSNLPEYARPYFENIMQRAQAESYRGYTPYQAERLAGFRPEQIQTQQETMGLQRPGQFGAATGLTGTAGLGSLGAGQQYMGMATDPTQMQAFMSPYQQAVTDVAKRGAVREAQIAQMQANLGAARQGTYGGARQTLAQAERERGLLDRLSGLQAEGSQKAFEAARQAQQYGADLGLRGMGQGIQAGQTLGQLGQSQQQADLQRLTAQEAVGAQQRAFEQQRLDQAYADFLRQRDYPMEQLGYFSNLLRGIPVQLGSTQTTYAQPPSIASQVGGLGLAGLSIGKLAGAFADGGSVISGPSPEELHEMGSGIGDKDLKAMENRLLANAPSKSKELNKLIMVAGELQAREDLREKAAKPKVYDTTLIADLLTGGAMPKMPPQMLQQVAMLPENAGGIAAMDAPNMENIATLAAGGLVAFEDGGPVARYATAGSVQPGAIGMPSGMGSAGGFQSAFRGPPDLDELLRRYGRNALKLFRSGVGMSPSNLLARSQDLNVGEQQYMDALRALNTEFGYTQEQLGGLSKADVIQRVETERRLAEAQKGKGPDVSRPKEITYFPQGVAPGGVPGGDQTQPGGGLDTLGKAQGLDMDSAFAKAKSFIGDKLAGLGDPFKDIKDEMKTASEERKADLKNSAFMRLAEFGFGMAAGTSPYALANIGKAGVEALKGFGDDLREKKKLDRDDRKMLADIKRLEVADQRDNIIKTADLGLKIIGEMNADQRARLAANTQLRVANIYSKSRDTNKIDPMLKEYLGMSMAQKAALDPATRAMLEQRLKTAVLPSVVESPGSAKIRP